MGPVWDFDQALANDLTYTSKMDAPAFHNAPWFNRMLRDPVFVKELIDRTPNCGRALFLRNGSTPSSKVPAPSWARRHSATGTAGSTTRRSAKGRLCRFPSPLRMRWKKRGWFSTSTEVGSTKDWTASMDSATPKLSWKTPKKSISERRIPTATFSRWSLSRRW